MRKLLPDTDLKGSLPEGAFCCILLEEYIPFLS